MAEHPIPSAALDAVSSLRQAIRSAEGDFEQVRVLYHLVCGLEEFAFRHVFEAGSRVMVRDTVTASVASDPESRLLTPNEAAALAGPSFTAKKINRLRGSMPTQAWLRKGGRLYYVEGPFRRWLAAR